MGRELRRVSEGWEHPRDPNGSYRPMHDESFDEAVDEYFGEYHLWLKGEAQYQRDSERTPQAFVRYYGGSPDEEYCRPNWPDEERTHFQVYETVSEGTPVSPVLPSKEAVIEWWVNEGDSFSGRLSREAAERWVEAGSSPSLVSSPATGAIPGAQIFEEKA